MLNMVNQQLHQALVTLVYICVSYTFGLDLFKIYIYIYTTTQYSLDSPPKHLAVTQTP